MLFLPSGPCSGGLRGAVTHPTPAGRPIPEELLERYVGLKPGQRPSGVVVKDTELCAPLMPV